MADSIVNIDGDNIVNPSQTVDIQLSGVSTSELRGSLSKGGQTYSLTSVNWNNTTKVWSVTIPANIPVGSDYELAVMYTPGAVITAPVEVTPVKVGYNAWSTMWNSLGSYNTSGTAGPPDNHNPSVHTLVGQMYTANNIEGYSHDFEFLPQGASYIDGTAAMNNINTTASEVMVLSSYGSTGGIVAEPDSVNGLDNVNGLDAAATACEAQNIHPVMFQSHYSADQIAAYPNAVTNTNNLLALHPNLGVIRTCEIMEAVRLVDSSYCLNTDSGRNKYEPPVETFYSGDSADDFHGSYAFNYLAALATFKYITGISATDNAFIIPDSGTTGVKYGMSDTFINLIISKVDEVQLDTMITPSTTPTAGNIVDSATQEIESSIDIATVSALSDNEPIILGNIAVTSITGAHFSAYDLTNGVFTYTPANTFTGNSTVTFTYTDVDTEQVSFNLVITISATGVAATASDFVSSGVHDIESALNLTALASVSDDVAIVAANYSIKAITGAHFTAQSLANGVFTFTPSSSFTGDSTVVFTYTDADTNETDFTLTLSIAAPAAKQKVWVAFGDGNSTSFQSGVNEMYINGGAGLQGAGGEEINGIRKFIEANHTVSGFIDTNGDAFSSVTAITGNLSALGFGGNADPEVNYTPDPALDSKSATWSNGETVQFSFNGLAVGSVWDCTLGAVTGWEPSSNEIDVDINGATGTYDGFENSGANAVAIRATVGGDGKLTFALSDGAVGGSHIRAISFIELQEV